MIQEFFATESAFYSELKTFDFQQICQVLQPGKTRLEIERIVRAIDGDKVPNSCSARLTLFLLLALREGAPTRQRDDSLPFGYAEHSL
jgi:hypothetical protein